MQHRALTAAQVLSNLLLVRGLRPAWINSAVPGGWSVGVEVMFYCLVPWLSTWLGNLEQALRFMAAAWVFNVLFALALRQWLPIGNI